MGLLKAGIFFDKTQDEQEDLIELCDKEKYAEFANAHKEKTLKFAVKILEENNIDYFCFGRLLAGAVHYNEFGWPSGAWDIAVFRKDYDKLYKIIENSKLPENVYFRKYYDDKNVLPCEVIYLNNDATYVEEDIEIPSKYSVIISPFDRIPEEFDLQNSYKRRTRRGCRRYHTLVNACINKDDSPINKIKWGFLRFILGAKRSYKYMVNKATEFSDWDSELYGRAVLKKSKYILKEQIYPLVKRKFYDYEISCPNDISLWTEIMSDALKEQIASIQKADLQLLSEFDRVCKILGIGYFVCGGTMLGQIRHGGFIPWDDDIDVALLRQDYDKFIAEGNKYLDTEKFFLQTRESDPEIPYLFSKVRLNNSSYITTYNERRNFHKGICLDLFPFDTVPDDEIKRDKFVEKVIKKSKKHNKVVNIAGPEPEYENGPKTLEERYFRLFGFVHRWIYKKISLERTQRNYIKVATKYNEHFGEEGYRTVASFVPSYTVISLDDLLPYKDVKFEDVDAKIPNHAKEFLTMQYGDFMELPPMHQRVGHDIIDWNLDN